MSCSNSDTVSDGIRFRWPVLGQMTSAATSTFVAVGAFLWFSDELVARYFALAAAVQFCGAIATLGQNPLLSRDLAQAIRNGRSVRNLLVTRLAAVALASLGVALILYLLLVGVSDVAPLPAAVVAAWSTAEAMRVVVRQALYGLGRLRAGAVISELLRGGLHILLLVAIAATPERPTVLALVSIGLASSAAALAASLAALAMGLSTDRPPASVSNRPLTRPWRSSPLVPRSSLTMMSNNVSLALTRQLSVVVAAAAFEPRHAASFALAMRAASGMTLVQSGVFQVLLPKVGALGPPTSRTGTTRVVGSESIHEADSVRTGVRRATRISTSYAVATLLVAYLASLALSLPARPGFQASLLLIGVASVLNAASGPAGALLVANHHETTVLASTVIFGAAAAVAPLSNDYTGSYLLAIVLVSISIAAHNGLLSGVVKQRLGFKPGIWLIPVAPIRFGLTPLRSTPQ